MTLASLVLHAERETGCDPRTICALAKMNWPAHVEFTATQARLLVYLIERKEKENCEDSRRAWPIPRNQDHFDTRGQATQRWATRRGSGP